MKSALTGTQLPGRQGERPMILLHSGWNFTNIGDIGHTPGMLRYLADYFPDAVVTCWLHKSSPDVMRLLTDRFPEVVYIPGGEMRDDGSASSPELQRAFDAADLFIYNSGMHYNRFWAPPLNLLRACDARGVPFVLYSQSFDGFRPQDASMLPGLLSKAACIYCRDSESLHFLRGAGVTAPILEFGPDSCFGIDVRDDARAAAFMRRHNLQSRRFITLTLRSDSPEAGDREAWSERLRSVIVDWVARTGLPVVLVPEVDREILAARNLVYDLLPDTVRPLVIWRDTFWNVDEAASFLAHARAVVSMEPHSCIIALANQTPAIHYFSQRHGWKAYMFRDIGLPEWLIDIDTEPVWRVGEALDRIDRDFEGALEKVRSANLWVERRSREMIGAIKRIVGR